ncbi:unnamed protein product, partial [Mesorhabditis spiculigera]
MITLTDVTIPTEGIRLQQAQVVAFFEEQRGGDGTLTIAESSIIWTERQSGKGFILPYPSIILHAVSTDRSSFPEDCLFVLVDIQKTALDVDQVMEEEDDEDEARNISIRFVPADTSILQQMYREMCECQELHPEADDDDSDDQMDDYEPVGDGELNSGRWFTSDNIEEAELNEDGLRNLERMSRAERSTQSALDAARTLLRNGEKVDLKLNGGTPLHIAASNDNLEMVQLLLHFGADPLALNRKKQTVLDVSTGNSKVFLTKLLTLPAKKQKGFLYRIFICHGRSLVNGLLKQTRKKFRRLTVATSNARPPSHSDPVQLPVDRHDPHPPEMFVEKDPLPLETAVIPGTPFRSRTPPTPKSDFVTTNRGGRPRARAQAQPNSVTPRRVRSKSIDEKMLQINSQNFAKKKTRAPPSNKKRSTTPPMFTPRNYKRKPGNAYTAPKNIPVQRNKSPVSFKKLPPPRPRPSAPPLEWSPNRNKKISSDYFTADESVIEEIEEKLRKLNVQDSEIKAVQKMTNGQLRGQLLQAGIAPGPITPESRKGWEKKLLVSGTHKVKESKTNYSRPLEQAMGGKAPADGDDLDRILLRELDEGARQFNYILLDPRNLADGEFKHFIAAIFYIGKGTGERPLAHLIDAKIAREAKGKKQQVLSAKIQRINEIWDHGVGVIQLELGKGVGDKLSFTREGCLMTAIGETNLTNIKAGAYYGAARNWDGQRRAIYGTHLLLRAHKVFNADRPQQIMPRNVPDQLFRPKKQ